MARIVIVDDRATNCHIFGRLAATIDKDVDVLTFTDPVEALAWLRDNPSDLIFTDYRMPGMDGAEFIRALREQTASADVPVIAITVYEERFLRLRALEAGATDFLLSPVDHHEFRTRARNLLALRRNQLDLAREAHTLAHRLEASERSRVLAVRDSSEQLAQVIDTLPAMISATDADGRILFVNRFYTEFVGRAGLHMVGEEARSVFGEEHDARSDALDRLIFETGKVLPAYEEELTDQHGAQRVFLTTKSTLKDVENRVTAILTSAVEITERKRTEAHLEHLAHHDPLTNLPNRTQLNERLRRLVTRGRRGDQMFALHILDLDGFKAINDLRGLDAGDAFLRALGGRLQAALQSGDMIARLGSDEFGILQGEVSDGRDVASFAQSMLDVVAGATDLSGGDILVSGSIGVAVFPADGSDPEALLKNAHLAVYKSKAEGGDTFSFYALDMATRARNAALLDLELRQAVTEGQFELFYQPQIDLRSGHIVGAEALLRWRHPTKGLLGPAAFLGRAEENGLIVPINEWVLREACVEAKRWTRVGLPPLRVGVNLSPVQFRKRTVPLLVAKVLGETGLDARRLDLELTESIVMQDMDAVANDLRQLLDLGVNVSLDDFGTGYSSLSYVKRFPVNRIKIDQSFVRNMLDEPNDAAIVRAILTLGHSLDLDVVAEGVETPEHLERLREEGCDEVQGFLFGQPATASVFVEQVRAETGMAHSTAARSAMAQSA